MSETSSKRSELVTTSVRAQTRIEYEPLLTPSHLIRSAQVRIPTGRSFVPNPMEVMPSMLVEAKDEFVESGSRGKFGGAKEAKAVKGLVTSMFTELVASNDVKLQIGELPKETRMPFLGEVQKKPPLLTSLQLAFDLFDVDASGTLSNKEVVEAFKLLGLSYRNSEVKEFLNTLDKDGDGEVDMKEFLTGLSPTMAKMISHQLEVNENMIIVLRAQRQQKLKDLASPPRSPREGFGGGGTMNRMASQQAISLGLVSTEELVKVEAEAEAEVEMEVEVEVAELPKETRMPFLGEVQKKPPLLTSLQLAFDLFDVDASGTLSNKEVVEAFKLLGLSYRNSEVKEFLNTLDKDGDGEVDMKEFLTGLSPTMAKMISHQLEVNENMIIVLRAQRQQKLKDLASPPRSPREGFGGGGTMNRMASQQAISLGLVSTEELVKVEAEAEAEVEMEVEVEVAEVVDIEGTEEENAASKAIQGRFRVRKAKKVTQHKRLLNTAEGQEMDRAALMIQGKSRQRKAKRDLAKAKREKTAWKIKESIQDEDLRDSVPRVLNETIFNLLREAMENDFDINKQPRTFAKTME